MHAGTNMSFQRNQSSMLNRQNSHHPYLRNMHHASTRMMRTSIEQRDVVELIQELSHNIDAHFEQLNAKISMFALNMNEKRSSLDVPATRCVSFFGQNTQLGSFASLPAGDRGTGSMENCTVDEEHAPLREYRMSSDIGYNATFRMNSIASKHTQRKSTMSESSTPQASVRRTSPTNSKSMRLSTQRRRRSSRLSKATKERPQSAAQRPSVFYPESLCVTICEFVFWMFCVLEFAYAGYVIGNYLWYTPVEVWIVPIFIASTLWNVVMIFVRFRVAVTGQWQLIDDDPKLIAEVYLRKWFLWDFVVSIPLDLFFLLITNPTVSRVASVLRVLRSVRIPSLFRCANPLVPERRIRILISIMTAIIYGHMVAAVIWMLINSPSRYYQLANPFYVLLTGLYWAVQTSTSVGFGDVVFDPSLRWQNRLLQLFIMLIGVGCYSYFIGYLSAIVIRKDAVEVAISEKKEKMNSMMNFYEVPWEIQKQAFSLYPRLVELAQDNYQDVLSVLPPFLQEEITHCIRVKLLTRVPMFSSADHELLRELATRMVEDFVPPGRYIIRSGDVGAEMFFIVYGVVEVIAEDGETGEEVQLALMRDGSWFGEGAMIHSTTRMASVRTVTFCDMMMLSKESFIEILEKFSDSVFSQRIRATCDAYWEHAEACSDRMSLVPPNQRTENANVVDPIDDDTMSLPMGMNSTPRSNFTGVGLRPMTSKFSNLSLLRSRAQPRRSSSSHQMPNPLSLPSLGSMTAPPSQSVHMQSFVRSSNLMNSEANSLSGSVAQSLGRPLPDGSVKEMIRSGNVCVDNLPLDDFLNFVAPNCIDSQHLENNSLSPRNAGVSVRLDL